ncbi:NUDIX hydrolase domain-like protein [Neurospora hispaniola]|uniref:NUDIX hydrolase domain-like protein n=1 Tax=Neurospora hispaniola TaxID=588809 RepID=A0AAJ0MTE3_9PEZI|nr:NUDIX hydrolase domain-like protein [Neurospora hispaniola]
MYARSSEAIWSHSATGSFLCVISQDPFLPRASLSPPFGFQSKSLDLVDQTQLSKKLMRNILTRYRYPAPTLFASASASATASATASRTRALPLITTTNNLTNQTVTVTPQQRTFKMTIHKTQEPHITAITDLSPQSSKWITLQQIHYVDQTGKPRLWEVAARKTRSTPTASSAGGIDAVAMCNILLHPRRPPSTILVIQYRPPMDAYTVEWPAGLIDQGETPEQAAVREFKEETGYDCVVKNVSPIQAADPGLSNTNMVMATVEVNLGEEDGEDQMPEQKTEVGEHIERVVVPMAELYERLVEYSKKERHVVAAKLFHFAMGMHFATTERYGVFGKRE